MNIPDLNKQGEMFTRSLIEKAKQQQQQNEVDEVTTSTTDTQMSYDFNNIPKK